jgi:murein DD-endopeptidase MepM/ murein hydrolase activator NlpD
MSRIAVAPGSHVVRGQVIGYVGSTGLSTGPHLHYELYRGGQVVDPASIGQIAHPARRSGATRRLSRAAPGVPGAASRPLALILRADRLVRAGPPIRSPRRR